METKDPVLSWISDRIKRNTWRICSMAERLYKESYHKLTVEKCIICNGDIIIPPQSLRKEVLKGVHDDVHCGITVTQMRLKLQA